MGRCSHAARLHRAQTATVPTARSTHRSTIVSRSRASDCAMRPSSQTGTAATDIYILLAGRTFFKHSMKLKMNGGRFSRRPAGGLFSEERLWRRLHSLRACDFANLGKYQPRYHAHSPSIQCARSGTPSSKAHQETTAFPDPGLSWTDEPKIRTGRDSWERHQQCGVEVLWYQTSGVELKTDMVKHREG